MDSNCENCAAPLHGPFCSQCGQEHLAEGPNLRRILADAWEEIFKVDGRIFTTMKLLFAQPGELTLEFFRGRRIRYITPLKLYLTASAIYFLVSNLGDVRERIQRQTVLRSTSDNAEFQKAINEVVATASASFFSNLSTILIFIVPITAFFSAGLFRGRKKPLLFHLVFALHVWSAMYLITSAIAVTQVPLSFFQLFFAVALIYGVFAIKRTFSVSWIAAVLKSALYTYGAMLLTVVVFLGFVAYHGWQKRLDVSRFDAKATQPALPDVKMK
jgi:hypothetical protein